MAMRTLLTRSEEKNLMFPGLEVRGLFVLMAFLLLNGINPGVGLAGVEEDIGVLREDMAQMKKDLGEIKSLLQGAITGGEANKSTGTVTITGRPTLGAKDAPVTIVEFSDFQCPYCRRYSLTVFPALKRDYIDTGKVRYVFRDFPLSSIHQEAAKAHESAHCAGDHNKYWEMHDVLFRMQKDLVVPSLKKYAANLGIDPNAFGDCLDSGRYSADIQKDIDNGVAAGVRGTPSFFIGKSESGESITGTLVRGAQPLSQFKQVIGQFLKDSPSPTGVPPSTDEPMPSALP